MAKPAFDPSKPFTEGSAPVMGPKPPFDPSKPFDEVPSTQAAPADDPTPDSASQIKTKAIQGVQALGKAGNVLWGTTTGPIIGSLIEKLSGKPVFKGSDILNAVNPTNLKTFPSLNEMATTAGVPEGGKLSDVAPGYATPGTPHPWYQPEKGGKLDPTLRGTGATVAQMAADPASYLTAGLAPSEKLLADYASRNLGWFKAGLSKLTTPVSDAMEGLGKISGAQTVAKAINATPLATPARVLTNPIGSLAQSVGKGLYASPLLPIEHEGEKFGKEGVANSLYRAGATTPGSVPEVASGARDVLGAAAQQIRDSAGNVVGSMDRATQPARATIRAMQSQSATPEAQALANTLSEGVGGYIAREHGVPPTAEIPGSPGEKILGDDGVMRTEGATPTIPADPGIPPLPSTANRLSSEKSWLYKNDIPQSQWDLARSSNAGQAVEKQLSRGLKEETERVVEAANPGSGAALSDINNAYGGLAATKRSQRFVDQRADRQLDKMTHATGIDATLGAGTAAMTGNPIDGGLAIALKKLLQLSSHGTMPTGSALRGLGESNTLDRLNAMLQTGGIQNGQNQRR